MLQLLYGELRRLAAAKLAREQPGQTLQATALVHEAWLRLGGEERGPWASRAQFFAAAAEAMRRILVDSARRKRAARHGGNLERVDIDSVDLAGGLADDDLLAIDEALDRLQLADPTKARLVKLHFFAGLNFEECAEALGVSVPTVKRYWTFARAWLYRELHRH